MLSHGEDETIYIVQIRPQSSLMPSDENPTVSAEASAADRDRQEGRDLGGDRLLAWRTQGTYERPQLRSLVAKHCEQLSSELVDVFRTEVEREVKQRVSEVIVSEATILCEQLRSKDEALLAAEARWKDLREEVELSNKMRSQLQERIGQLEATETELRAALNEQLEDVGSSHSQIMFSIHPLLFLQRARVVPPPLESRHLALAYERKESRMLCRLCV